MDLSHRRDDQQLEVRISFQRHETRVFTTECETHEVCVSQVSLDKRNNQQREVRLSYQQRHETCVSKPKCESRVCSTERELRVSEPCAPETCISKLRRKVNIRSSMQSCLTAGLFDPPPMDLRDYLTKKRGVHQITQLCCYEQLITAVLSECHYSSHISKQSVFNRLSYMSISRSAKRCRSRTRRTLLQSFIPKGKAPDYFYQTLRGLGYVSTLILSASESEGSLHHNHSSGKSSWESDVNVGNILKELSVNMVSISHLKDGYEEIIQSDTDP